MEGDVAAAIDAHELGAQLAQALGRRQQVRLIASAADGVDREVLEKEQPVTDTPPATLIGELVLQLPGRLVGDGAQPLNGQHPTVRGEERMLLARRAIRQVAARPA